MEIAEAGQKVHKADFFIFASCHFLSKIKFLITHLISGVKAVCSTLWRFFAIQKIQVVLAELVDVKESIHPYLYIGRMSEEYNDK